MEFLREALDPSCDEDRLAELCALGWADVVALNPSATSNILVLAASRWPDGAPWIDSRCAAARVAVTRHPASPLRLLLRLRDEAALAIDPRMQAVAAELEARLVAPSAISLEAIQTALHPSHARINRATHRGAGLVELTAAAADQDWLVRFAAAANPAVARCATTLHCLAQDVDALVLDRLARTVAGLDPADVDALRSHPDYADVFDAQQRSWALWVGRTPIRPEIGFGGPSPNTPTDSAAILSGEDGAATKPTGCPLYDAATDPSSAAALLMHPIPAVAEAAERALACSTSHERLDTLTEVKRLAAAWAWCAEGEQRGRVMLAIRRSQGSLREALVAGARAAAITAAITPPAVLGEPGRDQMSL